MKKVCSLISGGVLAMFLAASAFAGPGSEPVSSPTGTQGKKVQGEAQRKDAVSEYRAARQQRWKKVQEESAKRKGQAEAGKQKQEQPVAK